MKKILDHLKDNFIKGLIFLLPLLVILVLFAKAVWYLKGFSTKIAKLFGINMIVGISGSTIISIISLLVFCVFVGYFVRFSFMASFRDWIDARLADLLPGYSTYREIALQKINKEDEKLPYNQAVLIQQNNFHLPGFLMDTLPDGRLTIFVPLAGKPKEGQIIIVPAGEVTILANADVRMMHNAVQKLGAGMGLAIG